MIHLPNNFQIFLTENGFHHTQNDPEEEIDIYSSIDLTLRIVEDYNSFKSIDLLGRFTPNKWFSLNVVRSYILNNEDYLKALDFNIGYDFLIKYYKEVLERFDKKNYLTTFEALNKLYERRGEGQLFRVFKK